MTRTFRAGQLSQLVTFVWQQLSIYSYITTEASTSLAWPSMICVHRVLKLWGQELLLTAVQGSVDEGNNVLGNSLNPPALPSTCPKPSWDAGSLSGREFAEAHQALSLVPSKRGRRGKVGQPLCNCSEAALGPGKEGEGWSGKKRQPWWAAELQ